MQVKKYLDYVKKIVNYSTKRKYLVVLIVFTVWLLIFDKNSLINQLKNKGKLNNLETEKKYYLDKITVDSTKLYELKTDDENLEKYAREQYLMHKENEDVFIVIEEE
jgi:cell division protein DivIC